MKIKNLPREEREKLFISKMTELQRIYGNPIDDDWDEIKEYTDKTLNKSIADTIGQVKFEKTIRFFGRAFKAVVYMFIALGILGLLVFGIRQLF